MAGLDGNQGNRRDLKGFEDVQIRGNFGKEGMLGWLGYWLVYYLPPKCASQERRQKKRNKNRIYSGLLV